MELFDASVLSTSPAPTKSKRTHALFRFFDKDNQLLYVSQKPNFVVIMKYDWWPATNNITVEHFDSLDDIVDAKAVAIEDERPLWNGQIKSRPA